MPKLFLLLTCLLSSGCAAFQPASPTPVIIVVTATPDAAAPTATAVSPALSTLPASGDNNPTPSPGTSIPVTVAPDATATFPTKPTDVQYIRAKQDVNIRKGPGVQYDIAGGVYAGQTAKVTGVTNADATWWRVICPDGSIGDCWVSADPALTEPANAPGAGPTTTLSAQANSKTIERAAGFQPF